MNSYTNATNTILVQIAKSVAFYSGPRYARPVEITVARARQIIASQKLVKS